MDIDERLQDAWREAAPVGTRLADLDRRVARQRRRRWLLRAQDFVLTLVALGVFGHALVFGTMGPAHWLLLPFFVVFLPMAWIITLRVPRARSADLTAPMSRYVELRLKQLRTGLRDLWLARRTAVALVAYAAAAFTGAWLFGDGRWREAAVALLVYSLLWLLGTMWLSRRLRRRWLSEYRAIRRGHC
jgi:hypothetical protein